MIDNNSKNDISNMFNDLSVEDRANNFKMAAIHYKHDNQSLIQQNTLLKSEIKLFKEKIINITTYDGRINEYSQFKSLIESIIENSKPK